MFLVSDLSHIGAPNIFWAGNRKVEGIIDMCVCVCVCVCGGAGGGGGGGGKGCVSACVRACGRAGSRGGMGSTAYTAWL